MINPILEKIKKGEGINLEFKESKDTLNRDVYETVCAFLNRNGGEIFLGVSDKGEILGIDEARIEKMKKDFITSMNNPDKFCPTYYLSIRDLRINGKAILRIIVPESSQVHRVNGKIFDRNEDGDLNVTNNTNLVASMYIRKQSNYTENKVYPYLKLDDLRSDLISKVRKRALLEKADHPWKDLSDLELLKSAGMYIKDYGTGVEGFTLASVLVFGKDEVIKSVLPYHKIDAILRKENLDRYDDRDDVRTNLLDSYDRLINFIQKHLPDKFYLEGTQRISIRDIIFREIITNMLIHREYSNAYPSKLIIGKYEISSDNASKAHGAGLIDPDNFSPYPKNPVIAGIFKEMGLVDELGSGVRNLFKYSKVYFGNNPQLVEGDVFRITIELIVNNDTKSNEWNDERINERIMSGLNEKEKIIVNYLCNNKSITNKIAVVITNLSPAQVRRIFLLLVEKELIFPEGEGRNRKYILSKSIYDKN